MLADSQKTEFTLVALVVVVAIVVAFLVLLFPSILTSRETARGDTCSKNLGQLWLALHQRVDSYRRFPPVSYCHVPGDMYYGTCPAFVNAGCMSTVDPHVAQAPSDLSPGYSWIVVLLPYMDETPLYEAIKSASVDFSLAPWNPKVIIRDSAGKSVHPATMPLSALICPSFSGDPRNSQKSPYPQKAYCISNYVALAATNCQRMGAPPFTNTKLEPNGIVTQDAKTGLRRSALADGASKSLVLSESREDNLAVWFDGAVNWGVAVAPDCTSTEPTRQPDGDLGYAANPYPADVKLSIAQTGNDRAAMKYYMSGGKVAGINDAWLWGPSSAHAGGIVMHAFGDGAVKPIAPDIDINVYIRLVRRPRREPVGEVFGG